MVNFLKKLPLSSAISLLIGSFLEVSLLGTPKIFGKNHFPGDFMFGLCSKL